MSVAPPTIEMLWESVDPQIALKRFGFSDAASTARWVTAVVEAEWGTTVVSCERIVLSAGNALAWVTASDQRQLIAKWSVHPELFERLAHVSRLTSWLDAQGFPVSAPIPPLHGGPRAEVPGASMELQAVVPGSLLDVRDPGQVHAVGAAHAALHGLLADYPGADEFERTRGQRAAEPLVDRITHWLHSDAHRYPDILTRALRQSLEETSAELPPVQLVHNDFEPPTCCAGEATWSRCSTSKKRLSIMLLSMSPGGRTARHPVSGLEADPSGDARHLPGGVSLGASDVPSRSLVAEDPDPLDHHADHARLEPRRVAHVRR